THANSFGNQKIRSELLAGEKLMSRARDLIDTTDGLMGGFSRTYMAHACPRHEDRDLAMAIGSHDCKVAKLLAKRGNIECTGEDYTSLDQIARDFTPQMKTPQVAEELGVSLGGEEGAGAPTPASSAPSAAHGAGPLTVEQMKSSKYKIEAMGVVKGAVVSLKAGGGNEAWEVTDATEATAHLADARAATRQRVGARAMAPKTVDINAELEKRIMTLLRGFKRQVAMQPRGVDIGGWGADVVIGACMRAARVAHDKHCEVLAAVAILEPPTAVHLTGDAKYKKGELTLAASSTRFVTKAAGATWTDKPTSAVDLGAVTLQGDCMPPSALNVAILPRFAAGEKAKKPRVAPRWQVPSSSDDGNVKQSAAEVVLTDNAGTHKLNAPCAVNTKGAKP
ncbi:unnamed protein product, partial [Prorocentrum cordatum]